MLPKHQSECELKQPFQKSYFDNEYGERSIGEPQWKPHVRNALDFPDCQEHSIKGGNGLDWFSSIKCAELVTPEVKERVSIHEQKPTLTTSGTENVEVVMPNIIKPQVKEDQMCYEQRIEQKIRRRKKVKDVRNGIDERAGGDKSYYVPEYSEHFHCHGSTLPVANFGGSLKSKTVPDTFIPLVKLPLQPRIPFHMKENKKNKMNEINEVKQLDFWRPAEPLRFP